MSKDVFGAVARQYIARGQHLVMISLPWISAPDGWDIQPSVPQEPAPEPEEITAVHHAPRECSSPGCARMQSMTKRDDGTWRCYWCGRKEDA